jgi:hypothetical protein
MKLEPGMRVRCVDAYPNRHICVGGNYRVAEIDGGMVKVENLANWYADYRFKPVIRVKAPTRKEPSSTERLLDAMFGKL